MSEEREKPSVFGVICVSLLVFMCLFGYVGYQAITSSIAPLGDGTNEKVVQVAQGATTEQVFQQLEKDDLITSTFISKIYMKLFGSNTIYAGEYRLNDGMSLEEIIAYISNPDNGQLESNTLTVGEGDWAKTIASKIETMYPDYKAEDTLALWNSSDYINELAQDYKFLDTKALSNKQLKVKLEGYLYPETYYLSKQATLDEITRTFLDQFNKDVYAPLKDEFDKNGFTVEQTVTLASIVQFEAGSVKDMKMVSRVFQNRLEAGMKLESSATICYGLYDEFDSLNSCESQPTIKSPYNTYLNTGLTPGPILNPGRDAIEAVLEPAQEFSNPGDSSTDKDAGEYYFFASDIYQKSDYPGATYYNKTLEEHEKTCNELGLFGE